MADRYLLESSAVDGYLLEDSTGVLLLDIPITSYTKTTSLDAAIQKALAISASADVAIKTSLTKTNDADIAVRKAFNVVADSDVAIRKELITNALVDIATSKFLTIGVSGDVAIKLATFVVASFDINVASNETLIITSLDAAISQIFAITSSSDISVQKGLEQFLDFDIYVDVYAGPSVSTTFDINVDPVWIEDTFTLNGWDDTTTQDDSWTGFHSAIAIADYAIADYAVADNSEPEPGVILDPSLVWAISSDMATSWTGIHSNIAVADYAVADYAIADDSKEAFSTFSSEDTIWH